MSKSKTALAATVAAAGLATEVIATPAPVIASDALADLSKRDRWKVTTRLRVNVTANPKKRPSMAYDRFKGYFALDGDCSVQDALDKGLRMDDIRHDEAHGFISLAEEGKDFPALAGRDMVAGDL